MKTQSILIPSINKTIEYTIGQNAQDNHDIIDNALENDMWFHINNKPSCHIIASIPDDIKRKEMKYIIKQGAVLCKQYSYPAVKNLEIVYTKIKNITKTEKIGQVIPNPVSIITI